MHNTPGYVMAFDTHTGKQKWGFHTVPKVGEFGAETWEDNANSYTGNTGVWAPISVDLELGYAYLPVETPTDDYYGGHRLGSNLFGNSVVCVDIQTGKRVWHYQITHHDIWNYDLPSAPTLVNMTVNGRPVKALVQLTKQAYAYVLDRVTGVPIWPFEEHPVPASDVPGERAWPTQPHPTKPPAYDYQGYVRMTSSTLPLSFGPKRSGSRTNIAWARCSRRRPKSKPKARRVPGTTRAEPAGRFGRVEDSIQKRGTSTSRRRPVLGS
jgi:quinoprotein glucose dehydrogenase